MKRSQRPPLHPSSSRISRDPGQKSEGLTPSDPHPSRHLTSTQQHISSPNSSSPKDPRSDRPLPTSTISSNTEKQIRRKSKDVLPYSPKSVAPGNSTKKGVASPQSTDSARTVRGLGENTPGQTPAMTPSYPFPQMPKKPPPSQTPLHQPFTGLSPTISGPAKDGKARKTFWSQGVSPFAGHPAFAPREKHEGMPDNDQSPTPNLYEVVLRLNSEITLDTWWITLVQIMREFYKVERISLTLPADPTDIENVPWGQKSAYDSDGIKIIRESAATYSWLPSSSDDSSSKRSDASRSQGNAAAVTEAQRPPIESRHSFAGYEISGRKRNDENLKSSNLPARPQIPRRTTAAASVVPPPTPEAKTPTPTPTPTLDDTSTPQGSQSSSGLDRYDAPAQVGPAIKVYKFLQPLNSELDPLLEPAGVNRVISRGSVVLLTRNFQSNDAEDDLLGSDQDVNRRKSSTTSFDTTRKFSQSGFSESELQGTPRYEDFEQFATAPWSESPAPSPAIQHDAERNPFFTSGSVDEESFEPTSVKEDYTDFKEIEAIGIDNAATIIHLPLIHPLLSKAISSEDKKFSSQPSQADQSHGGSPSSSVPDKKAPIAILSVSSPSVPYPPDLAQSLSQLSPHLATSFHTCSQNSNLQERIAKVMRNQDQPVQPAGFGDVPLDQLYPGLGIGFESLFHHDNEDGRSSTLGSLASPSEHSNFSTQSPSVSWAGTPSVEAPTSAPGAKTTQTASLIPEPPTGYFDAKQRATLQRSKSGDVVTQSQLSQGTGRAVSADHRSLLKKVDTPTVSRDEGTANSTGKSVRETSSPSHRDQQRRQQQQQQQTAVFRSPTDTRHSLLHSHGADFKASFQSLPIAAVPRRPSDIGHLRSASTDDPIMPPPSERLLRVIIDALPVQIFIAAPVTGKVEWVNSRFLGYRDHSAARVLNDPHEAVHPEDLEGYMTGWTQSLQTGQQFQKKVRLRRYDGNYRYYYIRAAPLRASDQRIAHWVGTMIDLHDQHVAELKAARQQETAASESKYRALANSSPQIVFAVNPKRGISFCNTQWVAYSGQSEDEAKGVGFMEFVHPDDLVKCKLPVFEDSESAPRNVPISMPTKPQRSKSYTSSHEDQSDVSASDTIVTTAGEVSSPSAVHLPQRKLSELAHTGILRASKDSTGKPSYSTEVRLRSKTGEYKWFLIRVLLAEPLIQAEAEEETWYGTCTDITDHKHLESTLKETMDAKSRFLSNMSHEIRTPLNGIWGMTNFLIDSKLTSEQMDQVNVIRASTEGLRDLINDILDLSKVEAGMITLSMDWLHIRPVVEDVVDLTCSLALDKHIELNYIIESDVPATVKGDKFRFRQILLNVIGNAIKFTHVGEVFVRCSLDTEHNEYLAEDEAMVQIEVKDTGAGFSEKDAERLFKRFSQIDGSSTRQHGGTGLGLVISMQLVELHGGSMTANSVPDKGSTFTFSLKFSVPSKSDPGPQTPAPETVVRKLESSRVEDSGERLKPLSRISPAANQAITGSQITTSPGQLGSSETHDGTTPSSAGSEPSVRTLNDSKKSSMSSQSSRASANSIAARLELKPDARFVNSPIHQGDKVDSTAAEKGAPQPPIYSILVACPLIWTSQSIDSHLRSILRQNMAFNITTLDNVSEASKLLENGGDSVKLTHVVINLPNEDEVHAFLEQIFKSQSSISVVVISDVSQKKNLTVRKKSYGLERLLSQRRLIFVQKPVKPSKLAVIFDPQKSMELSKDPNQTSAQQVANKQKRLFEEMTKRLGDKDIRVLYVEDNKMNQQVMAKLFHRVSIGAEIVLDGEQAVEKVLSKPVGYFSIILMDLMMPNKDGYEACREIRSWETQNGHSHLPIIALSANVVNDVVKRCKEAGFNSYLAKPVDFTDLKDTMTTYLDPEDPTAPMKFMGDTAVSQRTKR